MPAPADEAPLFADQPDYVPPWLEEYAADAYAADRSGTVRPFIEDYAGRELTSEEHMLVGRMQLRRFFRDAEIKGRAPFSSGSDTPDHSPPEDKTP